VGLQRHELSRNAFLKSKLSKLAIEHVHGASERRGGSGRGVHAAAGDGLPVHAAGADGAGRDRAHQRPARRARGVVGLSGLLQPRLVVRERGPRLQQCGRLRRVGTGARAPELRAWVRGHVGGVRGALQDVPGFEAPLHASSRAAPGRNSEKPGPNPN